MGNFVEFNAVMVHFGPHKKKASQVWERLTGATTVVTPEVLVAHLREALSILECLGANTEPALNLEAVYKMA